MSDDEKAILDQTCEFATRSSDRQDRGLCGELATRVIFDIYFGRDTALYLASA